MVGSSKILTVSYGTFSCTLEGFDDSFSTMKAIAEYFRDLASDDRYFGAEPPTPDAEMLARIAEREVSRRVEAKIDDGSIVLKTGSALAAVGAEAANDAPRTITQEAPQNFVAEAADDAPDAAPTQNAPEAAAPAPFMPPLAEAPAQPAPMPFEPAALTPTDEYEDDDAPEDVAPLAAAPVADHDAPHLDADSVAAKLQRIRAVVGRGDTTEASGDDLDTSNSLFTAPDDMVENDVAEPQDAATFEDMADVETAEDLAEDLSYDEDSVVGDAALDFLNDALAADAQTAEIDDVEAIAQDDHTDQAEVADHVEHTTVDETTDEAEPEAKDDIPAPVRARVIRMRRNQVDAAVAAGALIGSGDDAEDTSLDDLQDSLTQSDDYELPDLAALTDEDGDKEENGTIFDDLGASAEMETPEEDIADLERMDAPLEEVFDTAPELDADEPTSLSADAEADLQAELASLVGDMETDEDTVVTDSTLDIETHDDLIDDLSAMIEDDGDSSQTALEDLQDEAVAAADFEAELEEDAASADGPDDTNAGPLRPRRVKMPGTIDENDGSMDRIMSQTEEQMSAPDSSRRRDAIDQLKAAVAATEADREIGDTSSSDGDGAEETFRDDLRQAVRPTRPIRPQRPTERADRTERPAAAPLKLVASQRVDMADEGTAETAPRAPIMPVRPRRVMKTDEPEVAVEAATGDGSDGGFAAFAQEMGASDLSDLLEAAAAYTSFVEGSEDFSRPQLMNKVKESSDQEYSREEGLRSFGTLLRQGRIMKVRNGRFQVSGESRFNPERQAG